MSSDCKSILDKLSSWSIEDQNHVFAAWAAGNAGQLPLRGPTVAVARRWLEKAGFDSQFSVPSVTGPEGMDRLHRDWRIAFISAARCDGYGISHGRASKFINVYNKARFLKSELAEQSPYCLLHPPIDRLLITNIRRELSGSCLREFSRLTTTPWSQLDSEQYEQLIITLRSWMKGLPFWKLEALWPGAR